MGHIVLISFSHFRVFDFSNNSVGNLCVCTMTVLLAFLASVVRSEHRALGRVALVESLEGEE